MLRNLISTLRKYPVPAAINVVGLVIALAAFITIAANVSFEFGYDRSYPTSGRIFRVDCPGNEETFRSILPNAFARDVINSSAHIEAGAMIMPYMGEIQFRTEDQNGQEHGYELGCDMVQPDFVKVFGMNILSGNPGTLEAPGTAMIPKSLADRIFSGDAVGKTLLTDKSWFFPEGQLVVGAVYEDFPANSNLRNSVYFAVDERTTPYTYGGANFICYLLLDDPDNATAVADEFNSSFDFSKTWMSPIELVPVEDIYFLGQGGDGRIFRSGSRTTTFMLMTIGILVLLSGVINFANFFTSLAPVRIRSINTRKVLGASTAKLRAMLTMETTAIALFCMVAAFFLAAWLSGLFVAVGISNGAFTLADTKVMLITAAVSLAAGIIAGLYPGWYATSFPPALVLKGNFGLSRGGRTFRRLMSGIQYAVAFVTLIFMSFVMLQNSRMRNSDTGFDKEHIAVAEVSSAAMQKISMLRSEAGKFPSIADMAFCSEKVGAQDTYSTMSFEMDGKTISAFVIGIDEHFLDVMGIDILEGRNFSQYDSLETAIISRYFMDGLDVHAGDVIPDLGEVVGVCADVRFNSVREAPTPVVFVPSDIYSYVTNGIMYFRLSGEADEAEAASEIRSLLTEADPYWPGQVEFYGDLQDSLYSNELRTARLVVIFSIIAAMLAICGVIGLVIFDTEYRRKETAVRRVFGAGAGDILRNVNSGYALVVLVCFAMSCPPAILLVSRWMRNFVDREPMHLWVFALVLAAVLALTAAIVTGIFYRRAMENPAKNLKSE